MVASESLFFSGRSNNVGAVDGRIAEKWFVRERKWISKTLGNNGGRRVHMLFLISFEAAPLEVQWRF